MSQAETTPEQALENLRFLTREYLPEARWTVGGALRFDNSLLIISRFLRSNIELRNFGVFEIKVRKSRKGRNPNKPEIEVAIPERVVVKFRAGKELRERISKQNAN